MSKFAKINNHYIRNASLVVGQAIMLLAVLFLFIEGCSQAPEQYKRGNPPTTAPRVEGLESDVSTSLIGAQAISGFQSVDIDQTAVSQDKKKDKDGGEEGDRDRDEVTLAAENSKKPIVFGVGAAGITFKTEFNEARKLLAKPDGSQSGQTTDLYGYPEGVVIAWRKLSPRTPEQIIVTGEYMGPVIIGGRFGNKKIGDNFGEYVKDHSRESWERVMIEIYNTLEKKDQDFNCVTENFCTLSGSEEYIVFNYPKGVFQFSKDRKELYMVGLFKHLEVGKLANDFDLVKGQIVAGDERIGLGDNWKSFKDKVSIEADTSVLSSQFSKKYNGVVAVFEKNKFDRSAVEPSDDSTLRMMSVGVPYEKYVKVSGKYVEVTRVGNKFNFELKDQMTKDRRYLSTTLAIGYSEGEAGKSNEIINTLRINFMNSLLTFIEQEIQASYPKIQTITYLNGQHALKARKDLAGKIRMIYPDNGGGQTIVMIMNSVSGDIVQFGVQKFDSPLDKRLSSDFLTTYDPAQSQKVVDGVREAFLGGIKLNTPVTLSDIDYGRSEATAETEVEGVGKIKTRVKYSRVAAIYTPYQAKKMMPKKVQIIEYEKFGVSLILEPNTKNTEELVITGIQMVHFKGIKNLCQLGDLTFTMGENALAVKQRLDAAIKVAKEKDSDFDCRYMPIETNDGLHQLGQIFFPDDNVSLAFGNRELNMIRLY